ncbi:geranylgeranylglycerol-phosphate geranylgeranyltransferase [Spirosoma panaciterrae]|uniref:geranylgeranylglycerol-phosphate geranylgeranyltransferase n=1 Tax=Spirosoma panaciterrae TaxID=496058 RepID=UPI00035C14A6|nr:geranylgeranylglycerol-phosphate geranylgeranyltransferase [Spirosoma panaciterrae]
MLARQLTPLSAFTFGFLRLIRLQNLLIVMLMQVMARLFLVGPRQEGLRLLIDPGIWLLCLSTVCIAAAGYIINDYFDVKIDLVNKPERVIIGRYLKRRVAMGVHQVLNVIGCLIGLYLSKWVFLIDVVAVTLLWFYSALFKRQMLIGNIVISFLSALSLLVMAIYYRHNTELVLMYALFSFGISIIREIIKDMQDIRGDARFGCRTLPIVLGLRRTKYVLYVLIGLFTSSLFIIAGSLHNQRLTLIFLVLLIPMGWLVYRLALADTRRDFGYLSNLCKIIILLGIVSMIWA